MPPRKIADPAEIHTAAAVLFERKGYAATTIDEIATEAGITKPTLYHYVDGKSAILTAIARGAIDDAQAAHKAGMAAEGGPLDRVRALIDGYLSVATRQRVALRILLGEISELDEAERRRVGRFAIRTAGEFAGELAACRRDGLISTAVDPGVASYLITAMLVGTINWYDPAGALGHDTLRDQILALLGLAGA